MNLKVYETEKFWEEEIVLLTKDVDVSIQCLDMLEPEYYYWVSEVFEEISEYFKSKELVVCMKRNAERTGVDCGVEIQYAIKALKN